MKKSIIVAIVLAISVISATATSAYQTMRTIGHYSMTFCAEPELEVLEDSNANLLIQVESLNPIDTTYILVPADERTAFVRSLRAMRDTMVSWTPEVSKFGILDAKETAVMFHSLKVAWRNTVTGHMTVVEVHDVTCTYSKDDSVHIYFMFTAQAYIPADTSVRDHDASHVCFFVMESVSEFDTLLNILSK